MADDEIISFARVFGWRRFIDQNVKELPIDTAELLDLAREKFTQDPPDVQQKRFVTNVVRVMEAFHMQSLREGQADAIFDMVARRDVICVRPTGSGKSLIFWIAALLLGGTTIVLSPLLALMQDQVDKLAAANLDVIQINSRLGVAERRAAIYRFAESAPERPLLVYMAPETLSSRDVQDSLGEIIARGAVKLIVLDEAHCVCTWGESGFRPQYQLMKLRETFTGVPVACFSATLTSANQRILAERLRLSQPRVHAISLNRPNIYYITCEIPAPRKKDDMPAFEFVEHALAFFLRKASAPDWMSGVTNAHRGNGMIYCHAKATCEKLSERLRARGYNVRFYHSEVKETEKQEIYAKWLAQELPVVVATSALGMGVDNHQVSFVIDMDGSAGFSECAQCSGRAGRDGRPATYIAFHSAQREGAWRFTLSKTKPGEPLSDGQRDSLRSLAQVFSAFRSTDCFRRELCRALDDRSEIPVQALCCTKCTRRQAFMREAAPRNMSLRPPPAGVFPVNNTRKRAREEEDARKTLNALASKYAVVMKP